MVPFGLCFPARPILTLRIFLTIIIKYRVIIIIPCMEFVQHYLKVYHKISLLSNTVFGGAAADKENNYNSRKM
jgi:hypothetical protein